MQDHPSGAERAEKKAVGMNTAPAVNANCTLMVPPAPLTAAGLATPYRLTATDRNAGPCHEANMNQSAFVEATILDPATGKLSIYRPLVIDDRSTPAAAPVQPTLPAGAVVGIWFGFQGDVLTLRTQQADAASCVNGVHGSPFGQFGYCNAPQFFAAANTAIQAGKLTVPPLGTAKDGKPCPTTRDFSVVDQDQSDNLVTEYLATRDGRIAQNTPANAGMGATTLLTNASDNGLLVQRIYPTLGCQPFTAPDMTSGGTPAASLALNELQAAAHQPAPVALVPPNDPMAQVNKNPNTTKANLYRAGVDQPPLNPAVDTGKAYCQNIADIAPARLLLDKPFTAAAASPDPAMATTLFGFLAQRLTATWTNLGCQQLLHRGPPLQTMADGTGKVTDAKQGQGNNQAQPNQAQPNQAQPNQAQPNQAQANQKTPAQTNQRQGRNGAGNQGNHG
nr:hypothetical protein [Pseudonocardia acidicola]